MKGNNLKMVNVILKRIRKVIMIILHPSEILRLLKYKVDLASAVKSDIIEANDVGEVIKTIKEDGIEKATFMKVYDLVVSGELYFKSPQINLMKYENSEIFPSSDFILCQNGVIWEKFHTPQFTKIIPRDNNLLKVEDNQIFIKKPKRYIKVKVGYSMCGVHSNVWSHFLVQYLPKLYLIPDIIKTTGQKPTIILPKYSDPHIHEIVYTYLKKIDVLDIVELNIGESAVCETLYHVRNTAWVSDHVEYISPADSIIPKFVAESLKKNLIADFDFMDEEKSRQSNMRTDKIYIGRTGGRNMLNSVEVQEYFVQKGFVVVEPHKLALQEKIKLFKNAAVIVGPLSGGFTNVVFCKQGTKVIEFTNFQRIFEPYGGFLADNFGVDFMTITGVDEYPNEPHSSYTVPLSKIIEACADLGI